MKGVRLVIHGRVHGVFFRQSTADQANRLGCKGFVRNVPDGTVEVWAEGEDDAVEALVRFCHQGPPMANVANVVREDGPFTGEFERFEVRR